VAPEAAQDFRGNRDQSHDVLVRDEAVNSGPAGTNYRVSSTALLLCGCAAGALVV